MTRLDRTFHGHIQGSCISWNPGGGGGGGTLNIYHSQYILAPKKGGMEVLGTGTTPQKGGGGLRHGHNPNKGFIWHGHESKKRGFKNRSCKKGNLSN